MEILFYLLLMPIFKTLGIQYVSKTVLPLPKHFIFIFFINFFSYKDRQTMLFPL